MLTQSSPLLIQEAAYRHGHLSAAGVISQPTITPSHPFTPPLPDPTAPLPKNGTLTLGLDQGTYALPHNDLPGITPLHLNENLFATAKAAVSQPEMATWVTAHLENLHSYPISGVKQLQEAIAANWHIDPEKIVIAHGSSTLLRHVVFYLLQQHDTLLVPAPGWSFYKAMTALVNAKLDTFPLLNVGQTFVYDKNLIAAQIEVCHPKVVLICSPNNPTGNVLPLEDFLWLAYKYPQVDFILDEAYYGFHDTYSAVQEKELLDSTDHRNVFVIRTFSKFYGLANLRIGFLIGSKVDAQHLQKIAPVFGLPSLNQAIAAHRLADKAYQAQLQQEYAAVNTYLYTALQQIPGFTPYQTYANFILVRHDGRLQGLENTLLDYGYQIKRETISGDRSYFRITYADLTTMKKFMAILHQLSPAV